jgi:hypothetical protein
VSLTGLSTDIAPSLSFAMVAALTSVRFKHEITVDDHAHRETRSDRQGRLDVKIALNDLLSGLIQAIAGTAAERRDDVAAAASACGGSEAANATILSCGSIAPLVGRRARIVAARLDIYRPSPCPPARVDGRRFSRPRPQGVL